MQVNDLISKLKDLGEGDALVLIEINGKKELIQEICVLSNPFVTNVIIKAKHDGDQKGKKYDESKTNRKREIKIS